MTWRPFDSGNSIGTNGSESGTIVSDYEHDLGARITLERDCGHVPFAISCGIYGWFCHTRFLSVRDEADANCAFMRVDLDVILHSIPLTTDQNGNATHTAVTKAISEFVDEYP